jgi:hypothetical protein
MGVLRKPYHIRIPRQHCDGSGSVKKTSVDRNAPPKSSRWTRGVTRCGGLTPQAYHPALAGVRYCVRHAT